PAADRSRFVLPTNAADRNCFQNLLPTGAREVDPWRNPRAPPTGLAVRSYIHNASTGERWNANPMNVATMRRRAIHPTANRQFHDGPLRSYPSCLVAASLL